MDPRLAPLAKVESPLRRRLGLLAIVSDAMRARGAAPPILVGGCALELYTGGTYATADVDLIVADRAAFDEVCRSLGLQPIGRHWVERALGVALEAPGSEVPERVVEVAVDGVSIRVTAVEELIVDRLNAYVHWRSARDGDWAELLLAVHAADLDPAFLDRRAAEEDVTAALAEVRARSRRAP